MKKLFMSSSLLFLMLGQNAYGAISPEVATSVRLSNTDVNRIVCPGKMSDLIFSKEKGITGHFSGNNAFIKFTIEDLGGGNYVYADEASELFIVCDGSVYTLIAEPSKIPSVTLRLSSPATGGIKKNIEHYKGLPLERQVLQLIEEGYKNTYPDSYNVIAQDKVFDSGGYKVVSSELVRVDGIGIELRSFLVTSKSPDILELKEKDFLLTHLSPTSILAVSLEDHNLSPGESTRLFIVSKKES